LGRFTPFRPNDVNLRDRLSDLICAFTDAFAKDKNKGHLFKFYLGEHSCFIEDFPSKAKVSPSQLYLQAYCQRIRLFMDKLDLSYADFVSRTRS
jgi:hypothetical protein